MRTLLPLLAFVALSAAYCTVGESYNAIQYDYVSLQDAIARCKPSDDGIVHLLIQGEYPMSDLLFDMLNSAKGYSFMAFNPASPPRLYGSAPKTNLPPQLKYLSFFEVDFDFEGGNCQMLAQPMVNSTLRVTSCRFYNGSCPMVWGITGTDSSLFFSGNTYCDVKGLILYADGMGSSSVFENNHDCQFVEQATFPIFSNPSLRRDQFCRELFGSYIVNSCYSFATPFYGYCLFSSFSEIARLHDTDRKFVLVQKSECDKPDGVLPLAFNGPSSFFFPSLNQLAGAAIANQYKHHQHPIVPLAGPQKKP